MGIGFVIFLAEFAVLFAYGHELARDVESRGLNGEDHVPDLRKSDAECNGNVPNCETCLDHRTCHKCQEGFRMLESYWGALCVTACPEQFFETRTNTNGLVCTSKKGCKKIPNCVQCEETFHSICDRCQDGFLLFQQETGSEVHCVEQCPAGFVRHGHTCRAEACEDFFCSRCKADWVLQYKGATKCLPRCPSGYFKRYDFLIDQTYCDICRDNCHSCQDSYHCDVCKDGFYLHKGVFSKCLKSCPSGFLVNHTESSGQICHKDMSGCLDQRCTQCKEGRFRLRSRRTFSCSKECPSGFYEIEEADKPKRCGRCAYNCQSCSSYRDCQQCKDGYFKLVRGQRDYCVRHCPRDYLENYDDNEGKTCIKATDTLLGRL